MHRLRIIRLFSWSVIFRNTNVIWTICISCIVIVIVSESVNKVKTWVTIELSSSVISFEISKGIFGLSQQVALVNFLSSSVCREFIPFMSNSPNSCSYPFNSFFLFLLYMSIEENVEKDCSVWVYISWYLRVTRYSFCNIL